MTGYADVREVLDATRDALHAWAWGLLDGAGTPLPITGSAVAPRTGPMVAILPYQTVLESQAATCGATLVIATHDQRARSKFAARLELGGAAT